MSGLRPTRVEVDLAAIRHNVRTLKPEGAELMAVVKADAYGHGDVAVARAALEAGATWIGVALVEEGLRLRDGGIEAPILVLSEFPPGSEGVAIEAELTPSLYSDAALERLSRAAAGRGIGVHVKVDTGMHRAGVYPPEATGPFVERVVARGLRLEALWTHYASSSEDEKTTLVQLERFLAIVEEVRAAGHAPTIAAHREQRRDDPVPGDPPRPRPDGYRDLRHRARPGGHRRAGAAPGAHLAFRGGPTAAAPRRRTRVVRAPLPPGARCERRHRAGWLRRRLPSPPVVPGRCLDPGASVPGGGERDDGSADRGLRRRAGRARRRRRPARPPGRGDGHRRRSSPAWPRRSATRSSPGSAPGSRGSTTG